MGTLLGEAIVIFICLPFQQGAGEGEVGGGGSHFLIEKICYSERYNDFFKSRLPFGRAYSFRAANKKS